MDDYQHKVCEQINEKLIECKVDPIPWHIPNAIALLVIDKELGQLINFIKEQGDWNLYLLTKE